MAELRADRRMCCRLLAVVAVVCSGWLGCRRSTPEAAPVPSTAMSASLARIGTDTIRLTDLSPGAQAQVTELELARYGVLAKEVAALLDRRVIQMAARAAGMEAGAFLKQEIGRRAPEPTADEVDGALTQPEYAEPLSRMLATLDAPEAGTSSAAGSPVDRTNAETAEHRARARAKREAAMREQIADRARNALRQARQSRARAALVKEWRDQFGASVEVGVPEVPRATVGAEGLIALGSASDSGTGRLQVFLDPTDISSVRVLQEIAVQRAAVDRPPAVFVAYLARGGRAEAGVYAEALQCAEAAGHGAAFHAALFATPRVPGTEKLVELATGTGMESTAFAACLQNHTQRERVERVTQAARALGVTRAPVLFLNGIRLTSEQAGLIGALARDDRGDG